MHITEIDRPARSGGQGSDLAERLLAIWESAVRQTHTFLTEGEIGRIKGYVPEAMQAVDHLLVATDEGGTPLAFMGIEGRRIEMLFVDAGHRGRGIGSRLVRHATDRYGADEVTVNEQNPQAVGFYEHMGFHVYKRTPLDEQGAPHPLLYMCKAHQAPPRPSPL